MRSCTVINCSRRIKLLAFMSDHMVLYVSREWLSMVDWVGEQIFLNSSSKWAHCSSNSMTSIRRTSKQSLSSRVRYFSHPSLRLLAVSRLEWIGKSKLNLFSLWPTSVRFFGLSDEIASQSGSCSDSDLLTKEEGRVVVLFMVMKPLKQTAYLLLVRLVAAAIAYNRAGNTTTKVTTVREAGLVVGSCESPQYGGYSNNMPGVSWR